MENTGNPKERIVMEKGEDGKFRKVGLEVVEETVGYDQFGKPIFEKPQNPPKISEKA